jgi:hypothetical protein
LPFGSSFTGIGFMESFFESYHTEAKPQILPELFSKFDMTKNYWFN